MARHRRLIRTATLVVGGLVVSILPPLMAASAAPIRLEAENAVLSQATVATNHTGFSGTGFVDYTNVAGGFIRWTANAASAGSASLSIRFANGSTASRPMDISVNGTVVAAGVSFGVTGSWDTWSTKTLTATLNAGANTVQATATGSAGGPNVDFLEFDQSSSGGIVDYQAENATISQGVVEANHLGFTGTGFVNYNNVVGSFVEWTVNAGTAGMVNFEIRYSNASGANRPMNIMVNGATVASNLAFSPTANWDTWSNSRFSANLNAGSNKVRATATLSTGGPNVDRLRSGVDDGGGGGAPTASQLLAKMTSCSQISNGLYKTDSETSRTIPVCGKTGAVFWKADMDIDCDGQRTTQCNENTDCCFQPDTAFHQSDGKPLIASVLPYTVVPSPSSTWDYRNFNIGGASVVAIIFHDQVLYTVVGDTGPTDIIGEASYASAVALGINPDPRNGGTDEEVVYLVFRDSRRVSPIENHDNAVTLGEQLAREFLTNN
jgi:Fungal chitosanase of glycosyl hydrolase group 75/Carbohydrate binding module (family 35)